MKTRPFMLFTKKRSFWLGVALAPWALISFAVLLTAVPGAHAQAKATVVEDIIARVNNQIITMSDYQKSLTDMAQEVQQDCAGCTRDRMLEELKDRQKDLL